MTAAPKSVQSALGAQQITFDLLAKQAADLGFDEAVLILSNSRKENLKLVRFHAVSETRAAVIVGETEHMLLDKLAGGAPLPKPAKQARPKSSGQGVG